MADQPTWRQGYDSLERQIAPRLESLLRSESFAVAVGLVARVQRGMQEEASRATRRVLHQLNLPAGTDVSRILNELGQLRRQVRELSTELADTKAALAEARLAAPAGTAAERRRPAAKRSAPKRHAAQRQAAKRSPAKRAAAPRKREAGGAAAGA